MNYKPWNAAPLNEDEAPIKTVSGTTVQMVWGGGGSPTSDHNHAFSYTVSTDDGMGQVDGQTESAEGHTHAITGADKTEPAADGHYHILPPPTEGEYPGTGAGAKAEGLDLLKVLDEDSGAFEDWIKKIVGK